MSRYRDYDDEENFPGQWELQEANWRRALKGKRGQAFLALLREALMALPEHRLIEGALCTIGADRRKASMAAEAAASAERLRDLRAQWAEEWRAKGNARSAALIEAEPDPLLGELAGAEERAEILDRHIAADGEGVCANGALLWYLKVREGVDSSEAFAALPTLLGGEEDSDNLHETAVLAAQSANVARSVAWEVAYRNDEAFARMTPEQRWQAMVEWIDRELAPEPSAA